MEFRVVTVAREFGSGGAEIARQLAARLGWNLLDNALVTQIAESAHVDPSLVRRFEERVDNWAHRVARRGIWSGAFEAVAGPSGAEVFDAETMATLANNLIREAHRQGDCVIVGRGAQCVLHGQPDTFHLFVYAPIAARVERLSARAGAPHDLAAWARETDQMRSEYVRHHFGCERTNPHLYSLMIDSTLGVDDAVSAVLAAMGAARETR
jgi:cytidylate kinase